jgi:Phosphorylase superfamily
MATNGGMAGISTARRPQVFVGTVASADRWNRAPERIRELAQKLGSLCEDMEAAAIALTCASHDVPFLTIKDISNNEQLRMSRFFSMSLGEGTRHISDPLIGRTLGPGQAPAPVPLFSC